VSIAATGADELAGAKASGRAYVKARADRLLDWLVAFWIFCGGFVITEPSPYELGFIMVLGVSLVAGFGIYRSTLGLIVITIAFTPFAIIAAFQVKFTEIPTALIFQAVTIFLFLTSYFIANYVAEAPQKRMRLVVQAYVATAVISAILGTIGYLQGSELLTRYGRAKALFNDPNVYGPFLILPAMFCLQHVLIGRQRQAILGGIAFMILMIGVFASFSRAAWGHFAVSAAMVYLLIFFLEAHAREKVRMLLLALGGLLVMVVVLAGMLSIPSVQRLFEVRATAQSYDEGETGRFGRQGYAYELALNHPWGIGPYEFRNLRIIEEPHNAYVSTLHVYGWGGGFMFILFIGTTIWRAVSFVARPGPNRLLLIPLVSVFVPLAVEAAIIDLDHWRHFFLVAGLIWGVTAGYKTVLPGEEKRHSALV
jgi:O-antigen ligase